MGRTVVEDALLRLDSLTKEESLLAVARNLEATHYVDSVVRGVDGNVKEIKTLAEEINRNVKSTKDGTQRFLSIFMHALIFFPHCSLKQKRTKQNVCCFLTLTLPNVEFNVPS